MNETRTGTGAQRALAHPASSPIAQFIVDVHRDGSSDASTPQRLIVFAHHIEGDRGNGSDWKGSDLRQASDWMCQQLAAIRLATQPRADRATLDPARGTPVPADHIRARRTDGDGLELEVCLGGASGPTCACFRARNLATGERRRLGSSDEGRLSDVKLPNGFYAIESIVESRDRAQAPKLISTLLRVG